MTYDKALADGVSETDVPALCACVGVCARSAGKDVVISNTAIRHYLEQDPGLVLK
jgi:hypothetical protein